MANCNDQDPLLDDPTIEDLFYRLSEAEAAAVMAQRQQALMRHWRLPSTYTTAELIEEARRSIRLADDIIALAGRWKF